MKLDKSRRYQYLIEDAPSDYLDNFKNVNDTLGHDYGDWKWNWEPSCISEGRRYRDCARCNEREWEDVPS